MKTYREQLIEMVNEQRFNKVTKKDKGDILFLYRLYIAVHYGLEFII